MPNKQYSHIQTPKSDRWILLIGVGLLLCFWVTRIIAIDSYPLFLDETVHIHTAELTREVSPFVEANLGRLFTIWWQVPFRPYAAAPAWMARVATMLAVLPGVAAVLGMGRIAARKWGMIFAGLFYIFSTYHLFFERLALSDPVSSSVTFLALYFAMRLSRRMSYQDAVLTGVMLFIAFGAKLSAIPYFGIPLAAALTLRPVNRQWGQQVRWLAVALATLFSLSAGLIFGLRLRDYDLLSNSFSLAISSRNTPDINHITDINRIGGNALTMLEMLAAYVGPVMFGLLLLSVVIWIIRRRFYLPLVLITPSIPIWVSSTQESRYWIVPLALLLLCGALMLAEFVQHRSRTIQGLCVGLVLFWGAVQWLPFAVTAVQSPADLNLPANDHSQYIASDATGFGLREVRDYLAPLESIQVIGALANCQGLRYTAWDTLPVLCRRISPMGDDVDDFVRLMDESRFDGSFIVLEDSPYVPDTAPGRLLTVIERPEGRANLAIYDLSP